MEKIIKTLKFDFNNAEDRNSAFDRICELRCLDPIKTRADMKITNKNIPKQKILELCDKTQSEITVLIEVEQKPAVGAAAIKTPGSIGNTPVDEVATTTNTANQNMNAGFSEDDNLKLEPGGDSDLFDEDPIF